MTFKRGKKFDGNCNHCGKYGHKEEDCFTKKREEERANVTNDGEDMVLMSVEDIKEDSKDSDHNSMPNLIIRYDSS